MRVRGAEDSDGGDRRQGSDSRPGGGHDGAEQNGGGDRALGASWSRGFQLFDTGLAIYMHCKGSSLEELFPVPGSTLREVTSMAR